MVRRYEKQNIESFLSNYYEKRENKYHSLPRYLEEASVSGVDHQSLLYFSSGISSSPDHIRSKSVAPSSYNLGDSDFRIDRSTSAQNCIFPSSSRTSVANIYRTDKEIFSDTSCDNNCGNSHFHDRNGPNDDVASDLTCMDNRPNPSYIASSSRRTINDNHQIKFFRNSSLRSLKNLINKLRGKKLSLDFSNIRSMSPHQTIDFTATNMNEANQPKNITCNSDYKQRSMPYSTSYCSDYRGSNFYDNGRDSHKNLSVSVESGVNTDAESGQWKNRELLALSSDYCDRNVGNIDSSVPALTGIVNHGNTCYINAVIQCLSNTDVFAEYFLTVSYLTDLKSGLSNKNAEKYGSRGQKPYV
uniref:ubiquitinyl hydrolase 1 n=1 Tax=Romanomermis culicivorax TaxID=13658 RepID=A0A915JQF8_ROMCU